MSNGTDDEDGDSSDSGSGDERGIGTRVYEGAVDVHHVVRDRTSPIVAAADRSLRPALASKVMALVVVALVCAIAIGGLFMLLDRTFADAVVPKLLTVVLVAGTLGVVTGGAIAWGGSRRTPYW